MTTKDPATFHRPFGVRLFERAADGRYFVEKLVNAGTPEERWACMSYGDADRDARAGKGLDRLIQRAEVLEGTVRIRRRDDVIVWESPKAAAEQESA